MSKKELKEPEMQAAAQTNVPPLPLPQNEKKRLVQAEVNLELFSAVAKEMGRRKYKIRTVMEWGLKAFLLEANPKEAEKLGITRKTLEEE